MFHERELRLGPVWMAATELPPGWRWRLPGRERPPGPETGRLLVPLRGTRLHAVWDGPESVSAPGDLYVHGLSPLQMSAFEPVGGREVCRAVSVGFPTALPRLPGGGVDRLRGRRAAGDSGVGALLRGFLTQVVGHADALRPADGPRLGTALLDLLSAFFAHLLESEAAGEPECRRRDLTLRIGAFIQQRLHEPGLSPATIAAGHHISVSYLHRLFQEHGGVTVSSWIRRQRLEAARRDLADPLLRATPIHRIAARRGFVHAAAFSRAFRAAYGLPPRDYRHRALAPQGPGAAVTAPMT
ncbi:AraC family transcriptional regulator [Streptomyces sparsogenes]|uniref:AraC family transcriptional regulator n=1 Tax=Streptomyces sparsogenes TaxID=67365 RepID=UPI0033E76D72